MGCEVRESAVGLLWGKGGICEGNEGFCGRKKISMTEREGRVIVGETSAFWSSVKGVGMGIGIRIGIGIGIGIWMGWKLGWGWKWETLGNVVKTVCGSGCE